MNYFKVVIVAVLVLFGLSAVFGSWFQVRQNERTVVDTWGKFSYVANPGLNFKVPFIQGTTDYPTGIQDVKPKELVNTYTVDNQEVDVMFDIFYRIPEKNIEFIFANNRDYKDRLFVMAIDRLKTEMGKVNVQVVAENRGKLRDNILAVLKHDAASLGIEVTDLLLSDLQFTKGFREAVNQAAIQKAMIESVEYQRQQAQKQAETDKIKAEGQANAARETAKGAADSRLFAATAEAKAIELQGEAQAKALKAQTEALKDSPSLVELKKAERWNGALPTQMLGAAPMPFMSIPTNAPGSTPEKTNWDNVLPRK